MSRANALPQGYSDVREVSADPLASVYRATDATSGRPVMLEVLDLGGVSAQAREAFDHEMETLTRLSTHPNVVTLYEYLRSDVHPVLVLEPTRHSLADHVRREGCVPIKAAIELTVRIAGALATSHRAGLLHRDVRPDTVAITDAGEAVLCAFGLARLVAAARVTITDHGLASSHVAPESLHGAVGSEAADVYGLASTAYQTITGHSPFRTGADEPVGIVLRRILQEPVAPLVGPGVPSGLSDVLVSGMAKHPAARPGVEDLARQLQDIERSQGWAPTPFLVFDSPLLRAPPARPDPDIHKNSITDATLVPPLPGGGSPEPEETPPTSAIAHHGEETTHDAPSGDPGRLRCANGHSVERSERVQRFCRYCGEPLLATCPHGHAIPPGARFCGLCGTPVRDQLE